MNFFEKELQKIVCAVRKIEDARFFDKVCIVGRACVGQLNGAVNVKLEFATCDTLELYEALKVTVINKKSGVIDCVTLMLRDLCGNGGCCEVRTYDGLTKWFGFTPSVADYRAVAEAVSAYLKFFV